MISLTSPLPIGNAVRLYLTPPAGAQWWRVLRRTADAFTGAADAGAVTVIDGCTDNTVLDITALENGTLYFYHAYYWTGTAWIDGGASVTATPAATYQGDDIDPQTLIRDRLEAGLKVEVARGALRPVSGAVPVLTAPFAAPDQITFPVVSVHLEMDTRADRSVGEMHFPDEANSVTGDWDDTEGWLSKTTLAIVGVSLNPDERIALRQAIQRVLAANASVFNEAGLVLCSFSQRDAEQFSENNAPLFITEGTFDCMAPSFVTASESTVSAVSVGVTTTTNQGTTYG